MEAAPKINIFNDTPDGITRNLAIFQRAAYSPVGTRVVAWRTDLPRVGQKTSVPIPNNYAVLVIYENDNGLKVASPPAPVIDFNGRYRVSRTGPHITIAQIDPASQSYRIEVEVDGNVDQKVEVCVTLGGDLLYPSVMAYPNMKLIYEMRPMFFAAFISMSTSKGDLLEDSDVSPSQIPVRVGETVCITGNKTDGYRLSIISAV